MKRKVILIRFVFIIILLHLFHKKTEKKNVTFFRYHYFLEIISIIN